MKIILLSGKQNTGKSRTLNILFNKITNSGKDNIVAPKKPVGRSDFEGVVKYNNKNVAIVSLGDYYHRCIKALIKYANCDVLILAYCDIFAAKLNNIVAKYDYHCVIQKVKASDIDNERACNDIMRAI